MPSYNFVIIGKSGVGKSSLVNHFFDKENTKVGQGKPVTGKEFQMFKFREPDLEINIYDSWGIEGGKTDEWTNYLQEFIDSKKNENISDWIHTVVYCIAADSKRLEEFEKGIINKLINEELNPIIVVTKSDLDSAHIFLKSIKKEYPKLSVVAICNVEKSIGLGSKKSISNKFGLNELKNEVQNSSLKSFEKRFFYIVQEITNKSKQNAFLVLEKEVDQVLNNHETNLIGNLSSSKLEIIEKEIIVKIKSYNKKTEDRVLNMYNQATQIYGRFSKNILTSIKTKEKDFRLEENKSFIERFMNTITFGKFNNRKIASFLISSLPFTIALTSVLFFDRDKIWLSLKGFDKQDLKESIMNKIKEIYS